MFPILVSVGCKQACLLKNLSSDQTASRESTPCNEVSPVESGLMRAKHVLSDQIEDHLRISLLNASTTLTPNEAFVILMQQREIGKFK